MNRLKKNFVDIDMLSDAAAGCCVLRGFLLRTDEAESSLNFKF